jgi:hypothetical protein
MKPRMHLVEISNITIRLTKILNNLLKHLKILIYKIFFQCGKLIESFQIFFLEEYWTRRPTFNIKMFLKILIF